MKSVMENFGGNRRQNTNERNEIVLRGMDVLDVNSSVITDELENVSSGEVDVYRQVDENYIDVYNVTRKYVVVLEPQSRSG